MENNQYVKMTKGDSTKVITKNSYQLMGKHTDGWQFMYECDRKGNPINAGDAMKGIKGSFLPEEVRSMKKLSPEGSNSIHSSEALKKMEDQYKEFQRMLEPHKESINPSEELPTTLNRVLDERKTATDLANRMETILAPHVTEGGMVETMERLIKELLDLRASKEHAKEPGQEKGSTKKIKDPNQP